MRPSGPELAPYMGHMRRQPEIDTAKNKMAPPKAEGSEQAARGFWICSRSWSKVLASRALDKRQLSLWKHAAFPRPKPCSVLPGCRGWLPCRPPAQAPRGGQGAGTPAHVSVNPPSAASKRKASDISGRLST